MKYLVRVVRIVEQRRVHQRGQPWVPNRKAGQDYNCENLQHALQVFNKAKGEPQTTSCQMFVSLESWVRHEG